MIIVYAHINKINGKVYIGQIAYLSCRWSGKGKQYTCRFKNAIDKCNTRSESNKLECELIAYYKSLDISYNVTDGGEGVTGYRYSREQKKRVSARFKGVPLTESHKNKISIANKGKNKSPEAVSKRSKTIIALGIYNKPVLCYNKNMNLLKEYRSVTEASLDTKVLGTHISRCARGKRPSAGGYVWKYKNK